LLIFFFNYIVENSLLTSLDVDQSTGNIYYTTQDSVKVFSPKDSTKRSLITGLSQPEITFIGYNQNLKIGKPFNILGAIKPKGLK
jgi:hypothetical protein